MNKSEVTIPRAKPRPADLVDDIRRRLSASKDRQDTLFLLGIDLLRRRQLEKMRERKA